jgi:hypothetical protein
MRYAVAGASIVLALGAVGLVAWRALMSGGGGRALAAAAGAWERLAENLASAGPALVAGVGLVLLGAAGGAVVYYVREGVWASRSSRRKLLKRTRRDDA